MRRKKTKITKLDLIVVGLILALIGFVIYRLTIKLNYKWNWGIIPQYLIRYDQEQGRWTINILVEGLLTTIRLSIWATLLATGIGALMGILRTTRRLFNRLLGGTYVELIRNIPPLVLVFIFYFFVSDQIMPLLGVEDFIRSRSEATQAVFSILFATPQLFTAFLSGVITIAVFQGAYITEIVRAGIQSIEKGQWEAAYALGLSWRQQMWYVVLPQATKRVLPPLCSPRTTWRRPMLWQTEWRSSTRGESLLSALRGELKADSSDGQVTVVEAKGLTAEAVDALRRVYPDLTVIDGRDRDRGRRSEPIRHPGRSPPTGDRRRVHVQEAGHSRRCLPPPHGKAAERVRSAELANGISRRCGGIRSRWR